MKQSDGNFERRLKLLRGIETRDCFRLAVPSYTQKSKAIAKLKEELSGKIAALGISDAQLCASSFVDLSEKYRRLTGSTDNPEMQARIAQRLTLQFSGKESELEVLGKFVNEGIHRILIGMLADTGWMSSDGRQPYALAERGPKSLS